MALPFVKFNNGLRYPVIGLGTWGGEKNVVIEAVKYAIDAGYRHIDTAFVYQNERDIGSAIREKVNEGVIKREDIYITSKLWNTFHRKDTVIPALKKSLDALGLDYLDLYLIHWPMAYKEGNDLFPSDGGNKKKILYSDVKFTEPWKVLERSVKEGLIKSIGVSNFNSRQIETLLNEAEIKPVVNQVECHPYLSQKKLHEYCKSKEIILTAYSPLGSPARPWAKEDDPVLLKDLKLEAIANKYKKCVAQILIRYQIEMGRMVIPKSVTEERIKNNLNVFDFELCSEDLKIIDGLNKNRRFIALHNVKDHKDYPFKIEEKK